MDGLLLEKISKVNNQPFSKKLTIVPKCNSHVHNPTAISQISHCIGIRLRHLLAPHLYRPLVPPTLPGPELLPGP